jgi:hypothetical protein
MHFTRQSYWIGVAVLCIAIASPIGAQSGLLGGVSGSDTTTTQDSIWRDPGRKTDKPDSTQPVAYVKREYDHKQQVIVGSVVMLCVALALVGMNNYNPRR